MTSSRRVIAGEALRAAGRGDGGSRSMTQVEEGLVGSHLHQSRKDAVELTVHCYQGHIDAAGVCMGALSRVASSLALTVK